MSFGIGASKNKSSSQSRSAQSSDSLALNRSGPIQAAMPHLGNLYNQAGMAYEQGYTPYQGAWHTGPNMGMLDAVNASRQAVGQPAPGGLAGGMPMDMQGNEVTPGAAPGADQPAQPFGVPVGGFQGQPSYMQQLERPNFQSSAQWRDPERERTLAGLQHYNRGAGLLGGMAEGGGGNPALEAAIARSQENLTDQYGDVRNRINQQFTGAGRTGSPSHARSIGESAGDLMGALGDVDTSLRFAAYDADQNRRLQAAQSLGQLGLGRHEGAEGRNVQAYGIDAGLAGQRYNTDVGADLQRYGIGADLYKADLGSQDKRYGIDAALAGQQQGLDAQRYGIDRQYDLGLRGADRADRQSLFDLSSQLRDVGQQGLDAQRAQHDYLRFAPWNWMNQYSNILHQAPSESLGYNRATSRGTTTSSSAGSGRSANFNATFPGKTFG